MDPTPIIGTLNEKPLHAALKKWYARPGDRLEVRNEGYVIDIVRGDLLIEIQTQGFGAMKRKLLALVENHAVRLVHPIPEQKWLVKLSANPDAPAVRRKSPKRNGVEAIFKELVSFPELMAHKNFSLEALLIFEEEILRQGKRWRRRRKGWLTVERRLLEVRQQVRFEQPTDLLATLPPGMSEPFTTADLAAAARIPRRLAQQMAYCLRKLELVEAVGKQGNALRYIRTDAAHLRHLRQTSAAPPAEDERRIKAPNSNEK